MTFIVQTSFEIPSELPYNLELNPPSNRDYVKVQTIIGHDQAKTNVCFLFQPTWEILSNYLRGKYPGRPDKGNFQVHQDTKHKYTITNTQKKNILATRNFQV